MNIKKLKEAIKDLPDDMEVCIWKFVECWSGNPEDTDLSHYEIKNTDTAKVEETFVEWEQNDPRRNDKRRTKFSNTKKVFVVGSQYD